MEVIWYYPEEEGKDEFEEIIEGLDLEVSLRSAVPS